MYRACDNLTFFCTYHSLCRADGSFLHCDPCDPICFPLVLAPGVHHVTNGLGYYAVLIVGTLIVDSTCTSLSDNQVSVVLYLVRLGD